MKKLVSLVIALALALSLCSFAAADGAEGKYYGGYDDMIDATIAVYQRSSQGDAANIWWWDFCREYFGINFTVTQSNDSSTTKSTMFASGDMVDVFYQFFMSSSLVVEQGVTNGNLIPLDEYITPEIMPNLSRIYEAYPDYRNTITAPDGHIYSLGVIQNAASPLMTFYINQRWLDDAGLAMPTTLDEFTTVMAAFKARESLPENEGKTVVPLTGDLGNQPRFIANAFGWITDSAGYLTQIALDDVDGEPCFIYMDEERFPEFMQVMKDYIAAGYFSADVFDDQYAGNQTAAQKAEDLTGFDQNTSNAINPDEWTAAIPLTSKWNDTPAIARSYNAINCASFNISSTCDPSKVERLMKWVDWLYDYDNYTLSHRGPSAEETDILYGLMGGYTATKNEETGAYSFTVPEMEVNGWSFGDYQNQRIQGIIGGYLGLGVDLWGEAQREYSPTIYRNKVDENVLPYLVDTYPNIVFFEADVQERVTELRTDINAYVNENYVAFISVEKEMSEDNLAAFFNDIRDLGYDELLGYYQDYYAAYKAAE